jgi:hypothetical protein
MARTRSPEGALNCRLDRVDRKRLARLPNGALTQQKLAPRYAW